MNIRLDGKRALVTGGSSGIGEAISISLAEAGAEVAVNFGHSLEPAQAVVEKIISSKGNAFTLQTDVADPQAVEAMFKQLDDKWGGIDILINNAGIDGHPALGWEGDIEAWRKVIEVNLFGSYHCAREALKRMIPKKSGVVLSTTSVHEIIAWSGYSAYTAAKAGVSMMTKTLAQEAAPHGVRVLAVGPGAIRTPINKAVWSNPESNKDLLTKIPLNRIGEPKEVADMVVVLVSDVGSYITGQTIFIDGGMTDYPEFAHGG